MAAKSVLNRPGWDLPLDHRTEPTKWDRCVRSVWVGARMTTLRELLMMRLVNDVTDKNDWQRKAFDDKIVDKWRRKASSLNGDLLTPEIFDWV